MRTVVTISILLFTQFLFSAENGRNRILSSDLNIKYEIIGPLGIPLGELANIEAEVAPKVAKGFSEWLLVTKLNGKKLKKPVKIHYEIIKWSTKLKTLKKGKKYHLRVYQDGRMIGTPHKALEEIGFAQSYGYGFATTVIIIKNIK